MENISPVPQELKPLNMTFSEAVGELLNQKRITRLDWDDKNEYGYIKDEYLMIHTKGQDHRWLLRDCDMMATDWIVL
jgi:hypothetical protein